MGQSLGTFQSVISENIAREDQDDLITDKVNAAILDIAMTVQPHEIHDLQTVTTSDGTSGYSLDSDLLSIRFVVETSEEVPLPRGSLRSYALRGRDSDDRGAPRKWIRLGNTIYLYQAVPDDNSGDNYTIEVFYLKRPASLSSSSDTSDLNTEWDEATELLATSKVMRSLREFEHAATYYQDYIQLLSIRDTPEMMEDEHDDDAHVYFTKSERSSG